MTSAIEIFLQYRHETDTNLTMRGMETHQCTVNITSKAISFSRCSDTFWIANSISREMSRASHLATSPTLPYVHLYSFTFNLSCIFHNSFFTTSVFVIHIITIAHPLSLPIFSLSHSLSLLTYTFTRTRLDACTCIHQNGWRVTRCLPVIRMNHRVAEKALGGLGLRISAYSPRSLHRPKSVGTV